MCSIMGMICNIHSNKVLTIQIQIEKKGFWCCDCHVSTLNKALSNGLYGSQARTWVYIFK
jgi:hypothetical protein